eukprot:EG_transcript_1388
MVAIKLKWRKERLDLDVDVAQPPEVLRIQVFSLTGVPPSQQRLIFKGHVLKDDDGWDHVDLRPGMVVMLVETHEADAVPEDAPGMLIDEAPIAAEVPPIPPPPEGAPTAIAPPLIDVPVPPATTVSPSAPAEPTPVVDADATPDPVPATEEKPENDPVVVDFERYDGDELAEDDFERINLFCKETNTPFVDPSFPPIPKSLFHNVAEADMWRCLMPTCHHLNPKIPDLPLLARGGPLPAVKCEKCGADAPLVALQARPTQWLRPPEIRDDVTYQIGGMWKVIREEARPDDIRQGALGNCWFMGAMSVLASNPRLVEKVLLTKEYNPYGVYQLQLCHNGLWRRLVVDDLFPCTELAMLAYTKGARRQLWVPLLEKAAAKLFQCYESLTGGTMSEALHLITGYPTIQIPLYKAQDRPAAPPASQPGKPDAEVERDENEDPDLLWAKLLSYHQAGYIMGLGCVGTTHPTKTILEVKAMGLGAPHAYSIMDVREVKDQEGNPVRLVQLRNPWGEAAPKTWQGDWGRDSPKWTFKLKRDLGMVNPHNVAMHDEMSVFWMSWEDLRLYFASLEVARIHPDWHEVRIPGWLSCGSGPGDYFELTPAQSCQADLALVQEAHKTRENAIGARPTGVDLGFALLRAEADGRYTCVAQHHRAPQSQVSAEVFLDAGRRYLVVPLSFALCNTSAKVGVAPRRCALMAFSSRPLTAGKARLTYPLLAQATALACIASGKKITVQPQMHLYVTKTHLQQEAGCTIVAENRSAGYFGLQVDMSDCSNMVSTRGSFIVQDTIAPGKRQVLIVVAPQPHAMKYMLSLSYGSSVTFGPATQFPPVDDPVFLTQLHQPFDCPLDAETQRLQATLQSILAGFSAPGLGPAVPAPQPAAPAAVTPSGAAASAAVDEDEEDEEAQIQAALRLSEMEYQATQESAVPPTDDMDMEAAIQLSMAQGGGDCSDSPGTTPAPPTSSDSDSVGPLPAGGREDSMDEDAALAAALALSMEEDGVAQG